VEEERLQNIIVVRTDRIGDVILTLPTVEALKSSFPAARVTMLVRSYTSGLAEGISDILLYDREGKTRHFFDMLSELRHAQFDIAVVAYPRFRIALLLWWAGIPVRVGSGYRWYSFFFNRRVYEHRKTIEKHESEYNLSFAKAIGCKIPDKPLARLVITEREKQTAQTIRLKLGLKDSDKLILIHPGSGGSARDWKPEHFAQLAIELSKRRFCVVITGGETEAELVKRVVQDAGGGVKSFISTLSLKEFAALIQTAKLFVANSTGPLHIAAAVGVPVIGFYPPVRVMSPKRWGPLSDKKYIFVPDPAQCLRCKGGDCQGNDCMEQIKVNHVVEAVERLIA
jgi:lipopolysaccharide heptosyltransferase II